MARFLVTGGSGLIGQALILRLLQEGHSVKALARTPKKLTFLPQEQVFRWTHQEEPSLQALQDVDVIIHLAGEGIADCRWSQQRKKNLYDSRVLGTQNLVRALNQMPQDDRRPKVFISGSAIGIYGSQGHQELVETSSAGSDFLAQLCVRWEQEALGAKECRVVLLRTSMVLDRRGGALAKMPPAILGRGQAWMSWIHLQDIVELLLWMASTDSVSGAYNAASPEPVQNKNFMKALAKVKGLPLPLWTPEWVLKLVLGEMSSVVLASQRVRPQKALEQGFKFKYPRLEEALQNIYS